MFTVIVLNLPAKNVPAISTPITMDRPVFIVMTLVRLIILPLKNVIFQSYARAARVRRPAGCIAIQTQPIKRTSVLVVNPIAIIT